MTTKWRNAFRKICISEIKKTSRVVLSSNLPSRGEVRWIWFCRWHDGNYWTIKHGLDFFFQFFYFISSYYPTSNYLAEEKKSAWTMLSSSWTGTLTHTHYILMPSLFLWYGISVSVPSMATSVICLSSFVKERVLDYRKCRTEAIYIGTIILQSVHSFLENG